MTCHRTSIGRNLSTSRIHREVIQAQGHLGSHQKNTRSSRPSFRTDRLMTCHRTSIGRNLSTSRIHREVIQAQGHLGSNQKSTGVRPASATATSTGLVVLPV